MDKKYNVITLCGSSRFKKEFLELQEKLTLEGNIVISVGVFGHADNIDINATTKRCLTTYINGKLIWQMKFLLLILMAILGNPPKVRLNTQKHRRKK